MDVRKIGAFISELRKSGGYTQAELAQLLQISHQAVSKWERGESLPDIGLLPIMAKRLGVTVDELLNGERTPPPAVSFAADHPDPAASWTEEEEEEEENEDTPPGSVAPTQAGQRLTLTQAVELAPFLSKKALEALVEQAEGEVPWSALQSLAPFLGRSTLEKLLAKSDHGTIELRKVMNMAPFVSRDVLDHLVDQAEPGSLHWDVIAGLGPFLTGQALSGLVHRAVIEAPVAPEQLIGLAPFLKQADLVMLVESGSTNALRLEQLTGLAPFLPQAVLERLVLGERQQSI